MTTNREIAEVARKAAEIIQQKGKSTGVLVDENGRICTVEAIYECTPDRDVRQALYNRIGNLVPCRDGVVFWSDLPTTTEAIIAKVFLQVADEIEVSDE